MSLIDTVFSPQSLHDSYMDVKKNVNFKYLTQHYGLNELREINSFIKNYKNGTFKFSKGKEFTLYERGHIRRVKPTIFKDRIPIHSFCQKVLIPILRKYIIYDNGASLKGRGIDFQRERLYAHLQKYYRKTGSNQGYILICDFSKFFDNLIHEKLIEAVGKKIKNQECMDFFKLILKEFEIDVSYMTEDEYMNCLYDLFNYIEYGLNISPEQKTGEKIMRKSVDIGNEVSQICGVFYPTKIDTLIKNVYGFKYYGRYMDDMYIIHNSKDELQKVLEDIKKLSKELGIHINIKKTHILPLNRSFKFLKVIYDLSNTGKVTMRLTKDRFIRERRKLKKFRKMLDNKMIPYEIISNQYKSWRGNITRSRKGNKKPIYKNWKQVHRMDKLFNQLFIEPFINGSYKTR